MTVDSNTQTVTCTVAGDTLTLTISESGVIQTMSLTRRSISVGVFTPPSSHTPLTQRQWMDGSIDSSGSGQMYSFTVTAGTTYYVWENDGYEGDDSKTLDVRVRAFHSSGTELFYGDDAYDSPETFNAPSNGTAYPRLLLTAGMVLEHLPLCTVPAAQGRNAKETDKVRMKRVSIGVLVTFYLFPFLL
jgi:hypothetical protein